MFKWKQLSKSSCVHNFDLVLSHHHHLAAIFCSSSCSATHVHAMWATTLNFACLRVPPFHHFLRSVILQFSFFSEF